MWWLSFMKLREILVGIIVGLFLAILFWSGDQYATQPKTGSDSGEFNLRLGFCCCCCCFFSEEHEISGYLPKKNWEQRNPWWQVRASFIQVAGVESQDNFSHSVCWYNHVHMQSFPCCWFFSPKLDRSSSCGCLLSTKCCWHREAEILAICFELPAGIHPHFKNKQSSIDSTQWHLSPVQTDRGGGYSLTRD